MKTNIFFLLLLLTLTMCGSKKSGNPPQLCVAFLSSGRLHYLEKVVPGRVVEVSHPAVKQHLDKNEPSLTYEIAWVDNGSPLEEVLEFSKKFPFVDKKLLLVRVNTTHVISPKIMEWLMDSIVSTSNSVMQNMY